MNIIDYTIFFKITVIKKLNEVKNKRGWDVRTYIFFLFSQCISLSLPINLFKPHLNKTNFNKKNALVHKVFFFFLNKLFIIFRTFFKDFIYTKGL